MGSSWLGDVTLTEAGPYLSVKEPQRKSEEEGGPGTRSLEGDGIISTIPKKG